jgi:amino acid adenylation domain-containing protein/FkbH-like protein
MKGISVPLHPSQRDVYVDQLIHTESAQYNIGGYLKLIGVLNRKKFLETVHSAAQVFDAFKMRFEPESEDFQCFVDESFDSLEVQEVDFSLKDNPQDEALAWMQNRFNKVFEIESENLLFEHYLIKISSQEYWFFGRYHHLITDGYGFGVFVKYLANKYKSLLAGESLESNYPSYLAEAEKASAYFSSADYIADSLYWNQKIGEKPKRLLHKKPTATYTDSNPSATHIHKLTSEQRLLLENIQSITGRGLQELTIAAFLIYFGQTTGESDFVFGIPIHKRNSRQLRNIVGMFSGIIPFKGQYLKEQLLNQLLSEISNGQRRDYRHQNYLIGDLTHDLKINASEGYLHEISINYEPLNFELDFGDKLKVDILRLANDFDRNPLQLCWRDYGKEKSLELHIHYLVSYFSKKEIELAIQRLYYVLNQFATHLDKPVGEIQILPPKERELLDKFNDNHVQYAPNKTILDLLEEQVRKTPETCALIIEQQKISYRELHEKSNQLAHYLRKKGVKAETPVPICIERSANMIIGMIGILKAGGAYVPIDPEYPEDRIQYTLKDTKAKVVLSSLTSHHKLNVDDFEVIKIDELWTIIEHESIESLPTTAMPSNLAYIIYTSGSTGNPKGVMIEHQNVYSFLCWCVQEFSSSKFDLVYASTSICFDLSVFEIFYPLISGKRIRLMENGLHIGKYLPGDSMVLTNSVPGVVQSLILLGSNYTDKISVFNIAGEPIPPNLLKGLDLAKKEVRNLYGPTEDTTYSTVFKLSKNKPILIGKPIANTYIRILNQSNSIMPLGVMGEICIGGSGLARGYKNLPEQTEKKFIEDPYGKTPKDRLYKTGDLGRWLEDGNIEYLGRIDDQVKIRGYRIEPAEIESILLQSDLVSQAIILAKDDKEGNKRLVGYVVAKNEFDREAIISYLSDKLPNYMVPALWVEMVAMPLTPNGKVDKKALPEPDSLALVSNAYEAPGNELEAKLVLIWEKILKLDKVGVNDNFFELGGHSLNAIQLTSRLHKLLNIKTDISMIFKYPSIKKLAQALVLEKQSQYNEIKRLQEHKFYKLSHAQKRFWILSRFKDGNEAYNMYNAFRIEGELNKDAFKRAFNSVIERHEILRTVFEEIDGEPYQKILSVDEYGFKIEEIDLVKNPDAELLIKNYVKEDAKIPFDLVHGPLLRAALFTEGENEFTFVFNIHHIVSDGWSKSVFTNEFFHLYHSYCKNVKSNLSSLAIQYKDYAAWHSASYAHQGEYWRTVYRNGIPVLNFPQDSERPQVLTFFGAMVHKQVSETLTSNLNKLALEQNMSLNNLLLSLYAVIVGQYSGQDDIVVGSLTSGRSHLDLENLIGVFINYLPIRLAPKANLKLNDYLSQSQKTLISAYVNQDYPFDLMVEDCIKVRDKSRNPFFDTMVNFHLENTLQNLSHFQEELGTDCNIKIIPNNSLQDNLFQSVLDFKLDIEPSEKMLNFYLSYNNRLFSSERMNSFMNDFIRFLEFVAEQPNYLLKQYFDEHPANLEENEPKSAEDSTSQQLKVALCSSFVLEPIENSIEYWCKEFEMDVKLEFTPYNQVFQQLLDPGSILNKNKGLNVLLFRIEDWLRDQKDISSAEQIEYLTANYKELIFAIENLIKTCKVPYLTGVVPITVESDWSEAVKVHLSDLNHQLEDFLSKQTPFQVLNLQDIAEIYEVDELFDKKSDELGHMPFTPEFYAALGTFITRKIRTLNGNPYKVIALDCDNTLWKGVCGELGATQVVIDSNFKDLQQFVLKKYHEGFLLVISSKNNEADVWEVFDKHPEMLLKREYFASHRINWEPKPVNLLSMAKELNLGIDSFIFIDDSEFEIEQMAEACSDVLTLCLPQQDESFLGFLNHIWEFDRFGITEEDLRRNKMYRDEKQRKDEEIQYDSFNDFLGTLNIQVETKSISSKEMERAVQLSLRTNQFNLNGVRKTSEEIEKNLDSKSGLNWIIDVKDRFGDYGIVGLLLANTENNALIIETFLLSCRVLGRQVEELILSRIIEYCNSRSIEAIECRYKPTAKNQPFLDFLKRGDWVLDKNTNSYRMPVKINTQLSTK